MALAVQLADSSLRRAAYPLGDWIEDGGSVENYCNVSSSDTPPVAQRTREGLGLVAGLFFKKEGSPQNTLKRKENIALYKSTIKKHCAFTLLEKNENFREALRKFEACQDLAQSGPLLSEFAEFRFLKILLLNVIPFFVRQQHGYWRRSPSAKERTQATGHAEKLLVLFKSGISLPKHEDQEQLERHLQSLVAQLTSTTRKPKATETQEHRRCLTQIATAFLEDFEDSFHSILMEIASLIGWDAEGRTIHRIIRDVRNESQFHI